jgi:hypothetical protein
MGMQAVAFLACPSRTDGLSLCTRLGDVEEDDYEVLIGAEGVVRLRHVPTGGLPALADVDGWAEVFALLQGGELFAKAVPVPVPVPAPTTVAGAQQSRRRRRSQSLPLPQRRLLLDEPDSEGVRRPPSLRPVPRSKSLAFAVVPSGDDAEDAADAAVQRRAPRAAEGEGAAAALKRRSASLTGKNAAAALGRARARPGGGDGAAVSESAAGATDLRWTLEGAAVEWLEDALLTAGAAARPLLAAAVGGDGALVPQTIIHCASLAWGDLLLWPADPGHALDWFFQLRVGAGAPPSDDEDEAGVYGDGDDDGSGEEHESLKDRDDDVGDLLPAAAAEVPASVAAATATLPLTPPTPTTPGLVRLRPPPLSLEVLGPAPAIVSVASRRQSRFGLGAMPKTPLGPCAAAWACARVRGCPYSAEGGGSDRLRGRVQSPRARTWRGAATASRTALWRRMLCSSWRGVACASGPSLTCDACAAAVRADRCGATRAHHAHPDARVCVCGSRASLPGDVPQKVCGQRGPQLRHGAPRARARRCAGRVGAGPARPVPGHHAAYEENWRCAVRSVLGRRGAWLLR